MSVFQEVPIEYSASMVRYEELDICGGCALIQIEVTVRFFNNMHAVFSFEILIKGLTACRSNSSNHTNAGVLAAPLKTLQATVRL